MNRHLDEPIFFTPPPTKIDRRMWKGGGGGGQPYYAQLEQLYGEQAAMARTMRGVAEGTVIPNYMALMQDANEFDSIANRERAASIAGADARAAGSANIKMQADELASLGVNPADFNDNMPGMQVQNAALEAGAQTGARDRIEQMGFARRKDITGMGMGIPGQASEMIGASAGGFGSLANMKNQDEARQNQYVSDAVQGGMNAYRIWRGADGGYVDKKQLRGIDRAPKMARGGFMQVPTPPAPPVAAPVPRGPSPGATISTGADAAKTSYDASMGKPLSKGVGESVSWLGDKTGSAGMSEFGQGMQMGQAGLRDLATRQATQAVDQALGQTAGQYGLSGTSQQGAMLAAQDMGVTGELGIQAADAAVQTAAAGAPEAAGVIAGATDAAAIGTGAELGTVAATAGEAAMGGLGAAGAALGTAVPVIGAGLAIASLLGAFGKDGGQVHGGRGIAPSITPGYAHGGRADGTQGGDVDGPGGPEDDMVPAWLSDGEYVLNADAVRHFGLDRLEKMNKIGLEKRRGISKENA